MARKPAGELIWDRWENVHKKPETRKQESPSAVEILLNPLKSDPSMKKVRLRGVHNPKFDKRRSFRLRRGRKAQ